MRQLFPIDGPDGVVEGTFPLTISNVIKMDPSLLSVIDQLPTFKQLLLRETTRTAVGVYDDPQKTNYGNKRFRKETKYYEQKFDYLVTEKGRRYITERFKALSSGEGFAGKRIPQLSDKNFVLRPSQQLSNIPQYQYPAVEIDEITRKGARSKGFVSPFVDAPFFDDETEDIFPLMEELRIKYGIKDSELTNDEWRYLIEVKQAGTTDPDDLGRTVSASEGGMRELKTKEAYDIVISERPENISKREAEEEASRENEADQVISRDNKETLFVDEMDLYTANETNIPFNADERKDVLTEMTNLRKSGIDSQLTNDEWRQLLEFKGEGLSLKEAYDKVLVENSWRREEAEIAKDNLPVKERPKPPYEGGKGKQRLPQEGSRTGMPIQEQPRTEVRPKGYGPAKAGSGGGKSVDMFNPRKPKKPLMSTGGFVAQ
tara:strand:- start:2958 stop:4250 length:1293 start_codon:yes stop_codon:yes gene_type:complete